MGSGREVPEVKHLTANQVMDSPHAYRASVAPDQPALLLTCAWCFAWARRRKDGDYDYCPSLTECRKRKAAKKP